MLRSQLHQMQAACLQQCRSSDVGLVAQVWLRPPYLNVKGSHTASQCFCTGGLFPCTLELASPAAGTRIGKSFSFRLPCQRLSTDKAWLHAKLCFVQPPALLRAVCKPLQARR